MRCTTRATLLFSAWLAVATTVRADPAADLPPSDAVKPELYATGFEFAEGPALDAAGNLFVVNYLENGTIGRITTDGTAAIFCDLRKLVPLEGRKPQANGLKIDRRGRLVASDSGAGRLLRIAADGKHVEVLADSLRRKRFNSVNDVALDPDGNIYFSDPGGSSAEKPIGSIYRYDASIGRVALLDTGLAFPNGLGPTPDRKYLCLSESARNRLLIYDLTADGEVKNRRVLIDFLHPPEGFAGGKEFIPDGLVSDDAGRLYVGTWTGGHQLPLPRRLPLHHRGRRKGRLPPQARRAGLRLQRKRGRESLKRGRESFIGRCFGI